MFDWIYSNREVFLSNYVEIGRNHGAAKKLQEEHNQFTIASNVSAFHSYFVHFDIQRHLLSSLVNINWLAQS